MGSLGRAPGSSVKPLKTLGFLVPDGHFSCEFTVKIDVGRLGVPAGGLRTFLSNGPSVFCVFAKTVKGEEEGRRGSKEATGRCGRISCDGKLAEDAIFVEWSLRFLHF